MSSHSGEGIPEPLKRREILYAVEPDRDRLRALGRAYLEAGRTCDACEFFEAAKDREGLELILRRAREEGDYFLFDRVVRAQQLEFGPDEWKELGDRAAGLRKDAFAYRAYLRAGRDVSPPQVEPIQPNPFAPPANSPSLSRADVSSPSHSPDDSTPGIDSSSSF